MLIDKISEKFIKIKHLLRTTIITTSITNTNQISNYNKYVLVQYLWVNTYWDVVGPSFMIFASNIIVSSSSLSPLNSGNKTIYRQIIPLKKTIEKTNYLNMCRYI